MGPKEVKREQASEDEYTDVETEHEEEPGAEHPTRAEREATAAAPKTASVSAVPHPPTAPPPSARRTVAKRRGREESEESERAPSGRSPFSPPRADKAADRPGARRHASRAAEEPSSRPPPGSDKGKGKRRRRGETQHCPICWLPLGNHVSSLSQHQYWNEDCNARRIFHQGGCTWTSARRQALQLKEAREDEYYNPVTPAPSMAEKQRLEGRAKVKKEQEDAEAADAEEKAKEKKKKRRRHRRHSPSPDPDLDRDRRRSKRPPPSDDEDDLPKVKRGPGGSYILQFMPAAR